MRGKTTSDHRKPLLLAAACAATLGLALMLRAQVPRTLRQQVATDERIQQPGWWPTKRPTRRADHIGTAACAKCHADIATTQTRTPMALTLSAPAGDPFLAQPVTYKDGPYRYEIRRTPEAATYSVSADNERITEPLRWAFGSGSKGQSFVLLHGGHYYEARLSYLTDTKQFTITPGQSLMPASSLEKAVGFRIPPDDVQRCFACHGTAEFRETGFDPNQMIAGITCESCHGPGGDHELAMAPPRAPGTAAIMNPVRLDPVQSVDFCGACHRTWWDTMKVGAIGIAQVRFPAARLVESRCWGQGDRRLTCIACHDPHRQLEHDPARYDARCLACHVTGTKAKPTADHPGAPCPKRNSLCVTCHMPKYDLPGTGLKFTEHRIRVVRKGERFPG